MSLETGTFLEDLVTTNPVTSDPRSEGDDHFRLVKTVLKNTFPGLAGRSWRSQSKSATYTVLTTDNMSVINCTAALTLNLTAAATLGNGHLFVARANGGAVTIDPAGAELVNGVATVVLAGGTSALVFCDGSAFLALPIESIPSSISKTIIDAKGDLIVGSAADTPIRKAVGADGAMLLPSSGAADGLVWVAPPFRNVINASLAFSVAGGALTCALKTQDAGDPADADPVFAAFPHAAVSNGSYTVRKIAAALSLVISAGSTLGHGNAVAGSIYHYLIDNAGAVEYAASNKFFGYSGIVTTTAEGGVGGADSASTMYSTTARTSVPFVCVGRTKDTQTTAGTWAATPSDVELAPFARKAPTIQVITTPGANTYTKPWDLLWAKPRVQAGGGGGGSSANPGSNQVSAGSGGGAGGYSEETLLAEAIGPTETATVGAGGAAATAGGTSSFGSLLSATGGGAGVTDTAAIVTGQLGGLGGIGSGGNLNLEGDDGGSSIGSTNATDSWQMALAGKGGTSHLGGGGRGGQVDIIASGADAAGQAGGVYGGGGGGAASADNTGSGAAGATGGAGAQGIIVVEEFYV